MAYSHLRWLPEDRWHLGLCEHIQPVLDFLSGRGIAVVAVADSNGKVVDPVVLVDGPIPYDDLLASFPTTRQSPLALSPTSAGCRVHFSEILAITDAQLAQFTAASRPDGPTGRR